MTKYQPMKMAAAEALYHTSQPASFSLFTIGTLNGSKAVFSVRLPRLLSFLATGNFSGKVQGIDNIQSLYDQTYGPGSYTPIIPVTYWSFRLMIGIGLLSALIAIVALWCCGAAAGRATRCTSTLTGGCAGAAVVGDRAAAAAAAGNSFGWIFTEMGRQPWIVFGQMKTAAGVSANSAGEVLASVIILTLLYGGLAVIEVGPDAQVRPGGPAEERPPGQPSDEDKPLELIY